MPFLPNHILINLLLRLKKYSEDPSFNLSGNLWERNVSFANSHTVIHITLSQSTNPASPERPQAVGQFQATSSQTHREWSLSMCKPTVLRSVVYRGVTVLTPSPLSTAPQLSPHALQTNRYMSNNNQAITNDLVWPIIHYFM